MFTLTFYGGAQTVTGSKYLITLENGKRLLLDCGMFQGRGAKTDQYNRDFGFEPSTVSYLILSHAHIDHCGLIPRLVKLGFAGKIYCTPPTLELASLILHDSAQIQENNEQDAQTEALYTMQDVEEALKLFVTVPYNQEYEIDEHLVFLFTDAGHVLGSAVVNLTIKTKHRKKQLCFTGDIGRYNNRILNAPQPFPSADYIICESTYGDKLHDTLDNSEEKLKQLIEETCLDKKGKLLIPAFSIGRTQELIYSLNKLAESNKLPEVPVFVDSPLAVYATDILRDANDHFNPKVQELLKTDDDPFGFDNLKYIVERDDSILLNKSNEPCVIISSSGMMEGGRIRHHLKTCIEDDKNTILMTGYCEPSTLGGQIASGAKQVAFLGGEYQVNAGIQFMKEYSAHADYGDLLKFLMNQDKEKLKYIFLVHGEPNIMDSFKKTLHEEGYPNVEIPGYRVSYEL